MAISYLYLRVDQSDVGAEKAAVLEAFVKFIVSDACHAFVAQFGFYPVPAEIASLGTAAVDALDMPIGYTPFTFETSTAAGTGQGAYVISEKRSTYVDYKFDEVDEAFVTLEAKVVAADHGDTIIALESQVLNMLADLTALKATQGDREDEHEKNHDDLEARLEVVTAAALTLAVTALAMAAAALFLAGRAAAAGGERRPLRLHDGNGNGNGNGTRGELELRDVARA